MSTEGIKTTVRERYGKAALQVVTGAKPGCCGGSCGESTEDPITSNLYTSAQTAALPAEAVLGFPRNGPYDERAADEIISDLK